MENTFNRASEEKNRIQDARYMIQDAGKQSTVISLRSTATKILTTKDTKSTKKKYSGYEIWDLRCAI